MGSFEPGLGGCGCYRQLSTIVLGNAYFDVVDVVNADVG